MCYQLDKSSWDYYIFNKSLGRDIEAVNKWVAEFEIFEAGELLQQKVL
jgi:hypothetical protein